METNKRNKKSRRAFLKTLGVGAAGVMLTPVFTSCDDGTEPPTPPPPPCHPQQLPNPTITPESEPGKSDGTIKNTFNYPLDVATNRDFSDKVTLQFNESRENLPPGNYYARWAANGTCPADNNRIVDITIAKGITPPIDIESITPYTIGSDQDWARGALEKLPNGAELVRLYDYMLKAYTHLQIHDPKDYIDEYNVGKAGFEQRINNTSDPAERERLQLFLPDDNFPLSIDYPATKPFNLNNNEVTQVNYYLLYSNPQFFLVQGGFNLRNSGGGQVIRFNLRAYYASAENRQKDHQTILDKFVEFKSEFDKAKVNTQNQGDVAKYNYDYIAKTLDKDLQSFPHNYVPRETTMARDTILGWANGKLTLCGGVSNTHAYINNRLGVPTIYQIGDSVDRDASGNITGRAAHAWNATRIANAWYLSDAQTIYGSYNAFLKGRGTGALKFGDFLWGHDPRGDINWPEISENDYPTSVRSMQASAREVAGIQFEVNPSTDLVFTEPVV